MQINQFYIIKTGHFHKNLGDTKIDWYEDIKNEIRENGYKYSDIHPFEYPMFTTFQEADAACRSDWNDLMSEGFDNYAAIREYTMDGDGIWNLTHEWLYSTEEEYKILQPIENEKGIYKLFLENFFSSENEIEKTVVYKYK